MPDDELDALIKEIMMELNDGNISESHKELLINLLLQLQKLMGRKMQSDAFADEIKRIFGKK